MKSNLLIQRNVGFWLGDFSLHFFFKKEIVEQNFSLKNFLQFNFEKFRKTG